MHVNVIFSRSEFSAFRTEKYERQTDRNFVFSPLLHLVEKIVKSEKEGVYLLEKTKKPGRKGEELSGIPNLFFEWGKELIRNAGSVSEENNVRVEKRGKELLIYSHHLMDNKVQEMVTGS